MSDPSGFKLLADALVEVVLDTLQQIQVQENIGLGNVDNTNDASKPVSTAQAAAIAAAVGSLTKASVGLNNVDNTSDVNKPTSTAQAAAITVAVNAAVASLTKASVGLNNVDNVSDVNKIVSTAQAASIATKLALTGGALSGALTLAADPAGPLQPATKQYVDLKAPILNPSFTGSVTLPGDPTTVLQAATKQYVDNAVNALLDAANAEQFKGLIDASSNPNYPVASSGWVYKISVAGLIGGASGVAVEIGDRVQCIVDGSSSGNQATVGANWWITQANVGFSSNGISLVTAANYAAMRTLLAITLADITDASANGRSLVAAANYAAMRTLLAITLADITDATANGRSLVSAVNYAAMKTLLTLNNVDNTSDVNKPVSTAQATADNLKPFPNVIINPAFRINQRGYVSGAALASGTYGHDRWKAGAGGGDYSFTQLLTSTQITIAASKTLINVIEDRDVEGGSYILSWTGTAQARAGVNSATPSGAYAASPVTISGQTAATVMSIEFNTGTLGTVKIERGATVTAFAMPDAGMELLRAQRYCRRHTVAVDTYVAAGMDASNPYTIPIAMRVAPTITTKAVLVSSNTGASVWTTGALASTAQFVLFQVTPTGVGRCYFYADTLFEAEL